MKSPPLRRTFFWFIDMDKTAAISYLERFMSDERPEQFKKVLDLRTRHLHVVLEDLYQPHNASAVLRSCDCFGVQDVSIIENDHKWEVNEGVSMGAAKWLTLHSYAEKDNNTVQCINELKKKGFKIIATTPHTDDTTIDALPIEEPTAIVFGSELNGISPLVKEHADGFLRIPMYGFTESFNISVACALTLYELTRRLRNSSSNWHLSDEEQTDLLFEWTMKSIKGSDLILDRYLKNEGI